MKQLIAFVLIVVVCGINARADDQGSAPSTFSNGGVLNDPSFFPVAIWLQSPANAARYHDAGINLYVGLWKGPTEEQLADLKRHGMHVICSQNAVGLKHKDDPTIVAWMHGDEPDNAQSLPGGKGYGPPILPARIVEDYQRIRTADQTRPVLLNLGQGVAWDNYIGRGVRRNHPEDYAEYVQGCDIVSFDIYPACHDDPAVAGKLWFVADGVSRLRKWSNDRKRVWNCIECTHIDNPKAVATPQQVKAEVWMSIIRGSRGLIYFVHQFKPRFIEAGLFDDPQMLAAVKRINLRIQSLAQILNSADPVDGVTIASSVSETPIEAMVKRKGDVTYVFAVGMRSGETKAQFLIPGLPQNSKAEVLDEDRSLDVKSGAFEDQFEHWGVHLYRITPTSDK